jgi:hypothetical protein
VGLISEQRSPFPVGQGILLAKIFSEKSFRHSSKPRLSIGVEHLKDGADVNCLALNPSFKT